MHLVCAAKVFGRIGRISSLSISLGQNGPGPRVIAFVLNAQINSVRTPDMLKLWGYVESAACKLCGGKNCTLHHFLVNCDYALDQGTLGDMTRFCYTSKTLANLLPSFNNRKPAVFAEVTQRFSC